MAKLKRKAIRTYIRFKSSEAWFLIGRGIDDMSVEMNGSFEQTTDITGETTVSDEGYKPQFSVSPYYVNPDDSIYETIKDLAMNRKSGDDAKAELLEVWIDDDADLSHSAWTEDAKIEISNYGGNTAGAQISYNVWMDGNRVEGTVSYEGKVPTFSPKSEG